MVTILWWFAFFWFMDNTSKNRKAPVHPDVQKLANRIRELRIEKGYTNYEYFAFDHELPRAQYGRYEKGEDLRFTSLLKIIRAFEMTPEEFFSKGFEED